MSLNLASHQLFIRIRWAHSGLTQGSMANEPKSEPNALIEPSSSFHVIPTISCAKSTHVGQTSITHSAHWLGSLSGLIS